MRLIDADALIESLTVDPVGCMGCPEPEWLDELSDILNTAPSIDLVTCGECMYREVCSNATDYGYCSTGERGELETIYDNGNIVAKLVCK